MQSLNQKQKITVLISGIFIELIIGAVYAYSVIRLQLENELNLNHTQSSIPYLTSLAVFAFMVMLSGRLMQKTNFYIFSIIGILAIGLGYITAAYANHYLIFTLGHGVLIGSGVGILYGIPVQIIQTVYKKNQGFVVGLTIAGFGLSTVLMAPLLNMSFQTMGFQHTLVTFGIGSTLFLFILFWLLTRKLDISKLYLKHHKEKVNHSKFLFTMFFIIFTLGIMFGLSMIGLTLYIGIDYYQMPANTIAIYMSLFALANGLFRPLFGYIYDRMHLKFSVILLSFLTLIVASIYVFFNPNQSWLFIATMILSWGSVGGWLSLMPTITKDIFGKNNFNRTYGHMYLSYGVAAVIGNLYTSILIDSSINLSLIFVPILCISLLTMITVSIMRISPHHKITQRSY